MQCSPPSASPGKDDARKRKREHADDSTTHAACSRPRLERGGRRKRSWEERHRELAAYALLFGDCAPSHTAWGKQYKSLIRWIEKNREWRRQGLLSAEQVRCLDAIGFVWDPVEHRWQRKYEELKAQLLQRQPSEIDDCSLLGWMSKMRQLRRETKLIPEWEDKLNDIGFVWEPCERQTKRWELRLGQLRDYKQEFGDCNVPERWARNPQLATWVANQRGSFRRGELSEEKTRRLDELGFLWRKRGANNGRPSAASPQKSAVRGARHRQCSWSDRLRQLAGFRDANGGWKGVSNAADDDSNEKKRLAAFARKIRRLKANRLLSDEQRKSLERIGFPWRTDQEDESEASSSSSATGRQDPDGLFGLLLDRHDDGTAVQDWERVIIMESA